MLTLLETETLIDLVKESLTEGELRTEGWQRMNSEQLRTLRRLRDKLTEDRHRHIIAIQRADGRNRAKKSRRDQRGPLL